MKIFYFNLCESKDLDDYVFLSIDTKPKDIENLKIKVSKDLVYYSLSDIFYVNPSKTDELIKCMKIAEKSCYALVLCLNEIFEKLNFEI